jgi:uncharacterized protein (TIGR03083 family)
MLSHSRYCDEIVTQAELLRSAIEGADLTVDVPSCPGWNAGQLVRHLGGAHRWCEYVVRSRTTEPIPEEGYAVRELDAFAAEDPAVVGPWLVEGATRLAETLRDAGPDTKMWTPVTDGTSAFYARRMTHETAMHRADGTLAVGATYTLDTDVAVDGIDEWMELGSLPMHFDVHPWMRELLGPGRTLHFHATDTEAEWVMDLTGEAITWRHAHEKSAVAVRGPVTELLLLIYKRRPPAGLEVLGDEELLDYWLERVSFG